MAANDVADLSAAETAAAIRSRRVSALEVIDATLARIERLQPILNCFITVCADRARDEARDVDRRVARGEDVGVLGGVPLAVKDLVNTAGVRTTFASYIHEHNVPAQDSVSIARLRKAGAILVGKTTTPEFGHMVWTEAPLFGRTRNAWNGERTSGGSSGGAAAACAAGIASLHVATCAGGSTRIPAACNGVVGFKQSLGLIPHDMAPDAFGNLSYITPTTRTVTDTALMLHVMSGPDWSDPHSFGASNAGILAAADTDGDLKRLRFAWRPFLGNTAIDNEYMAIASDAARTFEALGATMSEMADDMEPTEPMWLVLSTALWRARFADLLPKWRDRMSRTLVGQMERGGEHTAEMLAKANLQRTALYRKVQSWFDTVDVIVMPTLTRTAVPIQEGLFEPIEIEGRKVDTVRKAWFPYTHPFNLTGNPAVTLPAGFHSDDLPVAIQLVARRGADALLIKAAALFEKSRPWSERRPNLP